MTFYRYFTSFISTSSRAMSRKRYTILHGAHAVLFCIALKKRDIVELYYTPKIITEATRKGLREVRKLLISVPKKRLSLHNLDRLTGTKKHQGIALRCASRMPDTLYRPKTTVNSLQKIITHASIEYKGPQISLFLLDDMNDYVLGSITRIAAFYHVHSIFLTSAKNLESQNTSSAACGSIETMHFVDCSRCETAEVVDDFFSKGYTIVVADFFGGLAIHTASRDLTGNVLLLVTKSFNMGIQDRGMSVCNKNSSACSQNSCQSMCSAILHQEVSQCFSESAAVALALERVFSMIGETQAK